MKKKPSSRQEARGLLKGIECLIEVLLLSVLYYVVWRHGYYEEGLFPAYFFNGKYVLAGVYALLIALVFSNLDGFLFDQRKALDVALGQVISLFIINFITYFQLCLIANGMISPGPILLLFVLDVVVAVALVLIFSWIFHRLYAPHEMLLVYGTDNAVGIKIKMDARKDKYNIKKLISVEEGFEKICREIPLYDAVILNDLPPQIRNDILKFCYQKNIRIYAVPKISDILMRGGKSINLFDTPLICINKSGLSLPQKCFKRAMDILLSALILILFSPLLLIVALAIKLEDGGPVFYKQKRMTLNQREFEILKFRSMVPDAENLTGAVLAAGENDPRITKVGKLVRATRLDEIPQFFNILKGDMSIVGPRPERRVFVEEFCQEMPEFAFRMKVKGGLTGYAQIYGKYNTTPYDKLRLDLMYIENYSLQLDLKLIIMTIKIMFSRESTEGMDIAKENEKKKEDLLSQMQDNQKEAKESEKES